MASEVSLVGQIPAEVHQALCDRLSHLSQHGYPFTTHEVVYDGRDGGREVDESDRIRLRRTIRGDAGDDVKWTMVSLGRLEPERLNPEFLIRPVIVCPVNKGDAFEVVSALGYSRRFDFVRKGIAFDRGSLRTEIFRIHKSSAEPPMASPDNCLVTLSVTTSPGPTGPTSQDLRNEACAALRDMQRELKGLVDLGRVEP